MCENYSSLELKDFIDLLRDENNRLIKQLLLAQKSIKLLENYRNCLNYFNNNCECVENNVNKKLFNDLENSYKTLVKEDMKNCGITEKSNEINIYFNKKRKLAENEEKIDSDSEPNDNQIDFESELSLTEDHMNTNSDKLQSNPGNVLFNKFEENSKQFEDNEYRLMFAKTNDNSKQDLSDFKCNWFKCDTSFGSESSLNQHKKTIHFEVFDNNNYDFITSKPKSEIIIKFEEHINDRNVPKVKTISEKGFVCNWIGCELRFRTENELIRHKKSIHYCEKNISSYSRHSISFGLKPLTIHTLKTNMGSNEKEFKCSECEKSYSRIDRLKLHMSCEHNLGDYSYKTYKCNECEYETKVIGNLKRHQMRRHTGEKPFKCEFGDCGHCFPTSEQLKSHQFNRHRDCIRFKGIDY